MANLFTPMGFSFTRLIGSTAPNYAPRVRKIAAGNTTAIYRGDPIVSLASGYIEQAAPGTTQIGGIFDGCEYTSISQGRTLWSPYWPGADADGDVIAYVIDDPTAVFAVQSGNGGPFTLADVGANVNFAIGTGNTRNGISGAYVDFATIADTATLPFRIYAVGGDIGASPILVGNGSDITTEFNVVYVTFNNQDFKSLTGI